MRLRGGFEGFVLNTAFNLLNYPMHARQRRWRWRWGSALLGGLLGLVLGGAALHGLRQDIDACASELKQLQAQNERQRERLAQDKVRAEALDLAQRQQAQLQRVREQQRALARLHLALHLAQQQQGGRSAWALERLHWDGERLEMQGRAHHAQALQAAQNTVSEQLQSPLTLLSLSSSPAGVGERAAPDTGLVFVWQAPWRAVSPPAPRRSP